MSAAELRTIEYSGHLYRADPNKGDLNQNSSLGRRNRMDYNRVAKTANKHYRTLTRKNNPQVHQLHHFFTMSDVEVNPYRKKGTTYTKEWKADRLILLDIMDLGTRQHLATLFSEADRKALNTAFPIINNIVYRKSDDETVLQDRATFDAIGKLGLDGYYMERQTASIPSHNITPFHSEIGVCRHAFHKLQLISTKKHEEIPNGPTKYKTHKRRIKGPSRALKYNTNNNNNNNNNKNNNNVIITKRTKGALEYNTNNNDV